MATAREKRSALFNTRGIIVQEMLELLYSDKPAILFSASLENIQKIKKLFPRLHYVLADKEINPTYEINQNQMAAISKDRLVAEEMIRAQSERDYERVGRLLGYPSCCIARFENELQFLRPAEAVPRMDAGGKNSHLLNNLLNFSTRLKPGQIRLLSIYYDKNFRLMPTLLYM